MFDLHSLAPGFALMTHLIVVCHSESLEQVAANFGSEKIISALLLISFIETVIFFSTLETQYIT